MPTSDASTVKCTCGREMTADEVEYMTHCTFCEIKMQEILQNEGAEPKKEDILLRVGQEDGPDLFGFDPALLDKNLVLHFQGRQVTARVHGIRSFCDLDDQNQPRRLTMTVDLEPCDASSPKNT